MHGRRCCRAQRTGFVQRLRNSRREPISSHRGVVGASNPPLPPTAHDARGPAPAGRLPSRSQRRDLEPGEQSDDGHLAAGDQTSRGTPGEGEPPGSSADDHFLSRAVNGCPLGGARRRGGRERRPPDGAEPPEGRRDADLARPAREPGSRGELPGGWSPTHAGRRRAAARGLGGGVRGRPPCRETGHRVAPHRPRAWPASTLERVPIELRHTLRRRTDRAGPPSVASRRWVGARSRRFTAGGTDLGPPWMRRSSRPLPIPRLVLRP